MKKKGYVSFQLECYCYIKNYNEVQSTWIYVKAIVMTLTEAHTYFTSYNNLSGIFALFMQFPITAIREIKLLKKLHHENIIKLKEIVTSAGSLLSYVQELPCITIHKFITIMFFFC